MWVRHLDVIIDKGCVKVLVSVAFCVTNHTRTKSPDLHPANREPIGVIPRSPVTVGEDGDEVRRWGALPGLPGRDMMDV